MPVTQATESNSKLAQLIQTAMVGGEVVQTRHVGGHTLRGTINPLGQRYAQSFQLRPGLRLRIFDFHSQQGFCVDHQHNANFLVVLVSQLAGDYRVKSR